MNQPAQTKPAITEQEAQTPEFWEQSWKQGNRESFLKSTQEADPEAWGRFYDEVSDLYLEMWGRAGEVGERVAGHLLGQGLVKPDCRVLDIGCGPGALSVPLAKRGMRVLAVDSSAGMLRALADNAAQSGVTGIKTVHSDWRDLQPGRGFDLVLAGFFPPALTPGGLQRMERWSAGHCALTLGTGRDAHGFRKELWAEILGAPFPQGGYHLACAFNWLLASGRRPNLRHLQWEERLQAPLERVARFYRSYFAIFGHKGPEVSRRIEKILGRYASGGQVVSFGHNELAVLYWAAPEKK